MADIFVSYARADRDLVAPLVDALEAEGWSVWWDPAITPGDDFEDLIAQQLSDAAAVIVVWTPNSVSSRWVKGEARDAADREALAPVRFNDARLPIDFRAIHTTDLDGWNGDRTNQAFSDLKRALAAKLKARAESMATTAAKTDSRPTISICVLPFDNMSGDPEQEYFSDGVTEDIITDLSKVGALSVVSRNSAFSFKGKDADLRQIASQLGVSHILEGSVRKAGNRVRITAQLINAADDAHLWAERYDRDLDDIFALQDEISEAVVDALRLTLLPEEKRALEHRSTTNSEAYQLYLMARQFSVMGNERHQEIVVRICKRAVEIDEHYALAWATMAITQWDMHRRNAAEDDGRAAAEKAIAIDPDLAEGHAAMGAVLYGDGKFEDGLAACRRAIKIDPNSYESNRLAGLCAFALANYGDARDYFETAARVIPTEFYASAIAPQCYEALGDNAGAKAAAKRALERLEAVISKEPDHGRAIGLGVATLASLNELDRAKEWMTRGLLLDPNNAMLKFNFACAMSSAGELDRALDLLDEVIYDASRGLLMYLEKDTDFDPLRDHPRFASIIQKANDRLAESEPKTA